MCDNWKENYTKDISCKGIVLDSGEGEYVVKGSIASAGNSTIIFWAPNPPDYHTSFSGSGLPFPNPDVAYENTPNRGAVKAIGGNFEFRVRYPNSYYIGLGTVCVEPCVHVKVCNGTSTGKVHTIKLGNGIPFRMLTYPPTNKTVARANPMFYDNRENLPIRSQEKVLRDSCYPDANKMPKDFWGLKPAQ